MPNPSPVPRRDRRPWSWLGALTIGGWHAWAVWVVMGGAQGVVGPRPIAWHDHPLYLHSAIVTSSFLKESGTTAGYDPAFMAGHMKSVVFPASSTLPEVVLALGSGRADPIVLYKWYVLVATALVPFLMALAAKSWGGDGRAAMVASGLSVLYLWTDFPISYALFGMVPYLVAVPIALGAVGATAGWFRDGGRVRWLAAAFGLSVMALAHFTTLMVAVPALLWLGLTAPKRRWWGGAGLVLAMLVLNAFWWTPGLFLAATKGPSDFAFVHSTESVWGRLLEIATKSPRIEVVLWALGAVGLAIAPRRWALVLWAGAGLFWGYLAGWLPQLDFLQPGRHTYALYLGLALGAGLGAARLLERLPRRTAPPIVALGLGGLVLLCNDGGVGPFGLPPQVPPMLAPANRPDLGRLQAELKRLLKPGGRLLYEESGFDLPGVPDPFGGQRFSGLLPHLVPGIEVIGGPYLHAALLTNFSQFGEGKLCGKPDWGRDEFLRYTKLYKIDAIACWTPKARAFCRQHGDLVEVTDEGPTWTIGRIVGADGSKALEGSAQVVARPGELIVEALSGGVDGRTVLSYHWAPGTEGPAEAELAPVVREDDPVPFVSLRPTGGPVRVRFRLGR